MKCCVIGCGAAGIISAKHLKDAGIEFDVFEKMDDIGGTWIYTEKETDSLGTPVHTSMYKSLRTNQPKEIMEFDGFKYKMEESFIKSINVYEYFKSYIDKNGIMDYVKLGHQVKNVSYLPNRWEVTVIDLKTKMEKQYHYNAIMVCNGHHYEPNLPKIDGQNEFKGLQMHSKSYRVPDQFKDKNLLVIGFAYSGQDIADDASRVAKKVFLSHHAKNYKAEYFRDNVISKPDVKKFNQYSVTFEDDSTENIDAVLYCTGYSYTYPFLHESCGISVDDNYVRPLYKQFINISHPSMALVGLFFRAFICPLLEVQVKVFVKVLLGQTALPKEEDMWEELQRFENNKLKKGICKRKYHELECLHDYVSQLNSLANLEDLPEVLYKIYDYNLQKRQDSLVKYRYYNYKIINNNNFVVHPIEHKEQ